MICITRLERVTAKSYPGAKVMQMLVQYSTVFARIGAANLQSLLT